jgi:predicted metal-dependent TIM-barrel fold hydrolase
MTIAELIEELKKYPQDTRVVVSGYEGGVDDVYYVEETEIYLKYNNADYEEVKWVPERNFEKVPAVYLRN